MLYTLFTRFLSFLSIIHIFSSCQLSISEIQALQGLYDGTNGTNWAWKNITLYGPIWNFQHETNNICGTNTTLSWQGIVCQCGNDSSNSRSSNLGSLLSLDLSGYELIGQLPNIFQPFSNLIALNLENNQLNGTIPYSIGALRSLQEISLYFNSLSGTLPDVLGELANLTHLSLYSNSIVGTIPRSLGNLYNLKTFYLHENQISGTIPPELGQMINVEEFWLYSNLILGSIPDSFGNLVSITKLYINHNQLTGSIPDSLSSLSNLVALDLAVNTLSGTLPSFLLSYPKLYSISIATNCFYGHFPKGLCNDEGAGQELSIVVMDGLSSNPSCPGNRRLNENKPWFIQGFLQSTTLQGSLPSCIWSLPNLTSFHISGNALQGSLYPIPSYSRLVDVAVSHNLISGSIPNSIQAHAFSTRLDLSSNRISGTLVTDFNIVSSQQYLQLSVNRLSGYLPPSFVHTWSNMSTFDVLTGNKYLCPNDRLPPNDVNSKIYACGSSDLDTAVYSWVGFLVVLIFISLFCIYLASRKEVSSYRTRPSLMSRYSIEREFKLSLGINMLRNTNNNVNGSNSSNNNNHNNNNNSINLNNYGQSIVVMDRPKSSIFNRTSRLNNRFTNSNQTSQRVSNKSDWITNLLDHGSRSILYTLDWWKETSLVNLSSYEEGYAKGSSRQSVIPQTILFLEFIRIIGYWGSISILCILFIAMPFDLFYNLLGLSSVSQTYGYVISSVYLHGNIPVIFFCLLVATLLFKIKFDCNYHRIKAIRYLAKRTVSVHISMNSYWSNILSYTLRNEKRVTTPSTHMVETPIHSVGHTVRNDNGNENHIEVTNSQAKAYLERTTESESIENHTIEFYTNPMNETISKPTDDTTSKSVPLNMNRDRDNDTTMINSTNPSIQPSIIFQTTSRRTFKGFLMTILFQLFNFIITLVVNVVYVNSIATDSLTALTFLFLQVWIGCFKFIWSTTYIPWASKTLQHTIGIPSKNAMKHRYVMLIVNYLISPCIATIISNQSCFYYIFEPYPLLSAYFADSVCNFAYDSISNSIVCRSYTPQPFRASYSPPFLYSFHCGSALLVSYVPVLLYAYSISGMILPIVRLQLLRNPGLRRYLMPFKFLRDLHTNRLLSQNDGRVVLDGKATIVTLMLHLTVLLTFGLAYPMLGFAVAFTIVAETATHKLTMGKFLFITKLFDSRNKKRISVQLNSSISQDSIEESLVSQDNSIEEKNEKKSNKKKSFVMNPSISPSNTSHNNSNSNVEDPEIGLELNRNVENYTSHYGSANNSDNSNSNQPNEVELTAIHIDHNTKNINQTNTMVEGKGDDFKTTEEINNEIERHDDEQNKELDQDLQNQEEYQEEYQEEEKIDEDRIIEEQERQIIEDYAFDSRLTSGGSDYAMQVLEESNRDSWSGIHACVWYTIFTICWFWGLICFDMAADKNESILSGILVTALFGILLPVLIYISGRILYHPRFIAAMQRFNQWYQYCLLNITPSRRKSDVSSETIVSPPDEPDDKIGIPSFDSMNTDDSNDPDNPNNLINPVSSVSPISSVPPVRRMSSNTSIHDNNGSDGKSRDNRMSMSQLSSDSLKSSKRTSIPRDMINKIQQSFPFSDTLLRDTIAESKK